MKKITPFLWFDKQAEEAVNLYTSIFKDSKILSISRQGEKGPLISATFRLRDQEFIAFNAGPQHKFTEAVSFLVNCETQEEVDELWEKLSHGGEKGRCGWLKDRFGLSWQIIPEELAKMLGDKDPGKSKRVLEAMFKMNKIDSKILKVAYEGE